MLVLPLVGIRNFLCVSTGLLGEQPSGYSEPFPRGPLGHNSEKKVGFGVFGGAEHDGRVPVFSRLRDEGAGLENSATRALSRNRDTLNRLSAVDLLG